MSLPFLPEFPTDYHSILERIDRFDPVRYARTRNYTDGGVSYLSPYLSRGVISTRFVLERLIQNGFKPYQMEKFIQELAWRDYWQQVWIAKGDSIDRDLKQQQYPVASHQLSIALAEGRTGIEGIDAGIAQLLQTGYLHNHVRMYVAMLHCNVGQTHWYSGAQWMYYHLLDADWASNALSWQWVAGSNSAKKYIANQENINQYTHTNQRNSFLDIPYESILDMAVPSMLIPRFTLNLTTHLPETKEPVIDVQKPTLLYTFYQLDPRWKKEMEANRILLLDPDLFSRYPVCNRSIEFVLALAKEIPGLQVYAGSFAALKQRLGLTEVYFKEHPTNDHFTGIKENRDWFFPVTGYFPSFSAYWNQCKKFLNRF